MTDTILEYARANGIDLAQAEPMSAHTTIGIGGPAKYYAAVTGAALPGMIACARKADVPFIVIGKGSNLMFDDKGYYGLVLRLLPQEAVVNGLDITAQAGMALSALSVLCKANGFTGLEFAQGIPGTVGGAVFMNAGAYGGQIADTLLQSTYVDADNPQLGEQLLLADQHCFDYRHSSYIENPSRIITAATFRLKPGAPEEIAAAMEDYALRRRQKQPLEYPSAGSAFKRPPGHFAGKLIEDCGLKGFAVGGAQVSEKHAGFIINRGGATCKDIQALLEHIEKTVECTFGIRLEREIRIV